MIQLSDLPKCFTGNNYCFKGLVKPTALDEEKNILYVDLSNDGMEWQEEWDLNVVIKGLELGEYIEVKNTKTVGVIGGQNPIDSVFQEYESELINMFDNPYSILDRCMYDMPLTKKQQNEVIVGVQPKSLINRNDKCPCGSGLKYKKCCLNK